MTVQIRKLETDDVEIYKNIRLEMLQDAPESFGASYEETSNKDLSFFEDKTENAPIWGAFDNDELVGVAGYFLNQSLKTKHKAALWGVYVTPKFRGQNLAQRLSRAVIDNLPKQAELILTNVVAGNKAAEKTYKSLGFEQYGLEKCALKYNGQYYDEIMMVKFLK